MINLETLHRIDGRTVLENTLDSLPLEDFISEIAKAGFDIKAELSRRPRLQKKFGENKGDLIWVAGVTDEVTEHAFEYSKGDILRTPPAYELVEGKLFSTRFDAFAEELTSEKERKGSVRRGLDKAQKKLAEIKNNSFVIWSSPAGPLGFDNLEYDYSWTHIFWLEGVRARYVSLRTDFSLAEHLFFINLFLSPFERLETSTLEFETMKKIQQIMENPVVASSNQGISKLSDIGQIMKLVRPSSGVVYRDRETGRTVNFSEVIEGLERIDLKRSFELAEIQNMINFYENKLLQEELTEEEIIRTIGQYLLALNYYFRQTKFSKTPGYELTENMFYSTDLFYLVRQLQQTAGCAGGFKPPNNSRVTGYRTYGQDAKEAESEFFECPKCHAIALCPVGNKCPNCGITKEEWAKKSSQKICS